MDGDDAPAVASVALDHAGEVLIGQHMSDLKHSGRGRHRAREPSQALRVLRRQGLPPGVSMMTDEDRVVRLIWPGDDGAAG
jgi:hypothetical protein